MTPTITTASIGGGLTDQKVLSQCALVRPQSPGQLVVDDGNGHPLRIIEEPALHELNAHRLEEPGGDRSRIRSGLDGLGRGRVSRAYASAQFGNSS